MFRMIAVFVVICFFSLATVTAIGQGPRQSGSFSSLEPSIDALVVPLTSSQKVPGLSLAIVQGGQTVYAKAFGTTSLTEKRPTTPDTQYRLASVSKPFTAVAVFLLVKDGKLKLDEPARSYCSELSALNGAPTVRDFLMHRSGMRHSTDREDITIKGPVARFGASLSTVVHEPLRFTPGTKTLYTAWGYVALGCVIETASGKSYSDFMKERLFRPAGLSATMFDSPGYQSSTFSQGFRAGLLYGLRPSLIVDTRFKTPASGLISTVMDMTKFLSALFDQRLLPSDLLTEMFKVQRDSEGQSGFTAGWTSQGLTPLGAVFDYNGSMEGSTAFLEVVPEKKYGLALLANRERYISELQPIVTQARQLVLDKAR
jgi:CubicO group peptidase (beta-lactamase class C family)